MSLSDAHAFAFSLAATLMVTIVVFRAGDGTLGVYLNSQAVSQVFHGAAYCVVANAIS